MTGEAESAEAVKVTNGVPPLIEALTVLLFVPELDPTVKVDEALPEELVELLPDDMLPPPV